MDTMYTIKIILLLSLLLAVIVLVKDLMRKLGPEFRALCYSVGISVLLTVVVFYIIGYFN